MRHFFILPLCFLIKYSPVRQSATFFSRRTEGERVGTITKRPGKSGVRFRAEIRIKRAGEIVHREGRTFSTKSSAQAWIDRREAALSLRDDFDRVTVGDAIREYRDRFERVQSWGRTKRTTLDYLERSIGHLDAVSLTVGKLVDHISERRREVVASTAMNDLIWLAVVFKSLRPLGRPVALQAVQEALTYCRAHNLVAKARQRSRRPTADELTRLCSYFDARISDIPMTDIVRFAVASSRRQAEITRLKWSDNDPETLTGLVTDAKHPRKKEGNHRRFKYTREAWEIANRQPRVSEFIFPFNAKTIGTLFTRACHVLEIADLRFHDLRHEATSRLFEAGYPIVEVQMFTLHEDWSVLRRYTNLRPEDIKLR